MVRSNRGPYIRFDILLAIRAAQARKGVAACFPCIVAPAPILVTPWEYAQGSWLAPVRAVRLHRPLIVRLLARG